MIRTISSILVMIKEKIDKINPFPLALILLVIFTLLPLVTYNFTTAPGDMAEYINNPLRVINGELPYRDFWLLFPPGEVFLPALIYRLFGLNINILLVFSLIISAFVGMFSFFLGRAIFQDNYFASILAIIVYFNGITQYEGYTYIHMYFLLLLISAYFFMNYIRNNGAVIKLFMAGIFLGFAFIFSIYEVGAASLAFFIITFIHSKHDRKPFDQWIKTIAVFGSGILAVVGLASLALSEIWQPMIREIAIKSLLHGTAMNLPYFHDSIAYLGQIIEGIKGVWVNGSIYYMIIIFARVADFIRITISYLLPFLLLGISIWYLVGKRLRKSDKVIVLFFLLWGMFTFPKALGRSDITHLVSSITPLFFLLIFFLQKNFEKREENKTFHRKYITYGLIVTTLFLLIKVPMFLLSTGIALAGSHYEVRTEYGTLLFFNESEAINVNNVISYINKYTDERDYIFVTPWMAPPFYALTNRKNPTYYDSLIDLVAQPSDEKQIKICYDLLKKNTKQIIHFPIWGFGKGQNFLNTCPILQKCIEDEYELKEKYGNYWIYVQKSDVRKSIMLPKNRTGQ